MFKEKGKKKLPGWMIIPILLVLVLVFYGLSKMSGGGNQARQFQTVTAEKGNIKEVYNTSGAVESEKMKVFYSPVNAPILACHAKKGQAVSAGDLLVSFDTKNLERDNRQSELQVLSAKYSNQDAVQQSERAAESTAKAQSQSKKSIEDLEKQIAKKQTQISTLESEAKKAEETAQDNSKKVAEYQNQLQSIKNSQTDITAQKANAELELQGIQSGTDEYETTRKKIENYNVQLGELEKEYRKVENKLNAISSTDVSEVLQALITARQELEGMKSSLQQLENAGGTATDTELTGAQRKNMQVSENLAELAQLSAKELLKQGKEGIKAEFDGIISDVKAVEGSSAMQGGELFTLVSNQDVIVKLEVPAGDFENLVMGNKAVIKIGKNKYDGTLQAVDKIALKNEKGNSVIGAQVQIDNPDENIFIGVNAKITMTVAEKKDVLCLQNEVVNMSTEGDFVYVIQNGVVKKKMVELGVASNTKVEIVDGLEEGDPVVADITGDIKEGMKATAVSADKKINKE